MVRLDLHPAKLEVGRQFAFLDRQGSVEHDDDGRALVPRQIGQARAQRSFETGPAFG